MPLHKDDIFEAKFVYSANGQMCMNVFHWKLFQDVVGDAVAITDALLTELAKTVGVTWIGAILPIQGHNVSWLKVTGQVIWPLRYIVREKTVAALGGDGGLCTAQNVQGSFEKLGTFGARSNVGGMRIGGLSESMYSNGLLTANGLAFMQSIAAQFEQELTELTFASDWFPCILNKEKVPNTDPVKYRIKGSTQIFANQAKQTLRTQRTRTIGKGI